MKIKTNISLNDVTSYCEKNSMKYNYVPYQPLEVTADTVDEWSLFTDSFIDTGLNQAHIAGHPYGLDPADLLRTLPIIA